MKGSKFSRSQGSSAALMALVASGALFTAGCANMATTATSVATSSAATTVTGKLYGGNQPVAFATVNLWYAGQGPSAPASIGATTTTANDGAGSFSFIQNPTNGQPGVGNTFSCPTNNAYVYLVATGGNTLNTGNPAINNSASVFLAPLGLCSKISGFVNMSEVTTVATMAALQQTSTSALTAEAFATDGSGTAFRAMGNAIDLISNLVDFSTGKAVTSKPLPYGLITAGVGATTSAVTGTPETSKINLIANIISACVNNASASASACTTLFANATPPTPSTTSLPNGSFPAATDVLQATYYMLSNPTDGSTTNLANLFNLSPAVGAPYQPTLTSAPTDWTIAISYSSSSTCGTNSGHFINSAQDLAIDAFGGVWLANKEAGVGNLTQLGPTGVPVTCIALGTGAYSGVTIDTASGLNNIWVTDAGASNVYRYKPGTSSFLAFPTSSAAAGISADGAGNIYYSSPVDAKLYELPQAMNASAAVTPVAVATGIGSAPARVVVDGTKAVWTTSGSTFVTRTASSTPNTGTGFTSTQFTDLAPNYGLAVSAVVAGPTNYVFTGAQGSNNSLSQFSGLGTSYTSASGWPVTGLSTPTAVVTDGAQNVWALNNASGSNSLFAIGANKQAISPSGGFVKSASYLGGGRSMVIDQSGNIWIGLDGSNSITEVVGAAVPVVQPYSTGINAGTFQTIP